MDIGQDKKVYDEEIFGPVVTAIPFKDAEELPRRQTRRSTAWRRVSRRNDLSKAHRLIPKLQGGHGLGQ